jgi:hypothetical protein
MTEKKTYLIAGLIMSASGVWNTKRLVHMLHALADGRIR